MRSMKNYLLIALTILSLGTTGIVLAKPAHSTSSPTSGKYIETAYVVVRHGGYRGGYRGYRGGYHHRYYHHRPVVIHRHYYPYCNHHRCYHRSGYYYTYGY